MAKFVCLYGPQSGQEYVLTKELSIMGRQSACEIQVMDNMSSRAHCEIRRDGKFYSVVDLGSRNGTKLNGKKIREHLLTFGDIVAIGDTEYRFVKESGDVDLNDLLTKYDVLEKIGEGGMGIVYKAIQRSMARTVALKILSPKYSQRQNFVEQFIREARAAGQLNHPNIIQVHEVGSENDIHFFSMEFVDGPTCAQALRLSGSLHLYEALEIVRQSACALEYAHNHRLIHQDIKPDNVMIGLNNAIKVADLGISKSFEEAATETHGGHKKLMGTPAYMAPEAALGKKIDHRIDLYSLGIMLYHLIAGRAPFTGESPTEILRAHITESPQPLDELAPRTPESVCVLVDTMMAKDPNERFQTAREVIQQIEKLLTDESIAPKRKPGEDAVSLRRLSSLPGAKNALDSTYVTPGDTPSPESASAKTATPLPTKKLVAGAIALVAILSLACIFIPYSSHAPSSTSTPTTTPASTSHTPPPVVVPPTPLPPDPAIASQQRQKIAKELTQLEEMIRQPSDNVDLADITAGANAIRLSDHDGILRGRIAALLDTVATIEQTRRADDALKKFQTLKTTVQELVDRDHDFDQALSMTDSFSYKDSVNVKARWAELRNSLISNQALFNDSLKNRIQLATSLRSIPKLKDIRSQLPTSYQNSEIAKDLDQSITRFENDQKTLMQNIVKDATAAFAAWDINRLESIQRNNAAVLAQSPAKKQIDEYIAAVRTLTGMTQNIEAQLNKMVYKKPRYQGSLAGYDRPELDSANKDGVQLSVDGGIFTVRWQSIASNDLITLSNQVLGNVNTKIYVESLNMWGKAATMVSDSSPANISKP